MLKEQAESRGTFILKLKIAASIMTAVIAFGAISANGITAQALSNKSKELSASEKTAYEYQWNNSTDAQRYYFSTDIKAWAVGMSVDEFKFMARVVEGEGAFCEDDITDKVMVACVIFNRTNCERWPTDTVTKTLQRKNQFHVVDEETLECNVARTLDSEWAIVEAYRLVTSKTIDCHMVYFNSLGFTGYSRSLINYVDCGYCKGNYFSCVKECECDFCTAWDPEWDPDEVEMFTETIERPIGSITKDEQVYPGRK